VNYYEHHLGDYMRDTAHLSFLEDAAYRRLLDAYYIREAPVPVDLREACRLVRAVSKQERDAVAQVLREFFIETPEGWRHGRCEREIERFQDKQRKASASANARWNKHKPHSEGNANASQNAMRTHSEGNAHQTPDTRHQTQTQSGKDGGEPLHPPLALSAEPDVTGFKPTQAELACRAIKAAGVIDVNPGHAGLLRLLDGGVTVAELASTAEELVGKGKGKFALLLATVEGRRVDAAAAGDVAKAPEVVDPGADAAEKTKREQAEFMARPVSKPPEALKALVQKLKVTA